MDGNSTHIYHKDKITRFAVKKNSYGRLFSSLSFGSFILKLTNGFLSLMLFVSKLISPKLFQDGLFGDEQKVGRNLGDGLDV